MGKAEVADGPPVPRKHASIDTVLGRGIGLVANETGLTERRLSVGLALEGSLIMLLLPLGVWEEEAMSIANGSEAVRRRDQIGMAIGNPSVFMVSPLPVGPPVSRSPCMFDRNKDCSPNPFDKVYDVNNALEPLAPGCTFHQQRPPTPL
ncbi:hypothetical protein NDU88_001177 [Pleurodeles waltl]|uniref:Uncharacterized protein n=1 Tax=Pleurodeles waltl TaxID=8319 RepID=A0AAV7RC82_PLEWA|nr:hypothetical protein NDU88_001177 [Pleurodeles waltl]